jgi:hypothetical protein
MTSRAKQSLGVHELHSFGSGACGTVCNPVTVTLPLLPIFSRSLSMHRQCSI